MRRAYSARPRWGTPFYVLVLCAQFPASDTPPPYGRTAPAPCRATRLPRRPLEPHPEGRPALVAQLSPRVTSGAAPGRRSQARWVESDRGFLGGWVVGMPTTHATGPGRPGPVPPAAGRLPRLIQAPRFATAPADPYAGRRCHAGVGRRQPGDAPVRHRSRGLRPPRNAMRRAYGPGRAEVRR